PHDDDRDPRQIRILGLADRQAVDVEAPRREHPRDVRQHAGPVLHQRREEMPASSRIGWLRHGPHLLTRAAWWIDRASGGNQPVRPRLAPRSTHHAPYGWAGGKALPPGTWPGVEPGAVSGPLGLSKVAASRLIERKLSPGVT